MADLLHRTTTPSVDLLGPLVLSDHTPMARGRERLVFRHPHAAGLVIKVIRADVREGKWGDEANWRRRRSRLSHHTLFMRELREYLVLRVRMPEGELPMARIIGLVDTDLGLGLITELVQGEDGRRAPTLRELFQARGLTEELRSAVDRFACALLSAEIVVNDINATNLVARRGADGQLQLVLVDGFGDRNFVPLLSLNRRLNRRNSLRRLAALRASLEGD